MSLSYTEHAIARLAKRQLKAEWVERIVARPDRTEPDPSNIKLQHCIGVLPELENRVLRVIVSKDEPRRVITAYLDRKMKDKL
ncbi:MAG: DUF4258 domain-containing protein [Planctomycetales bacterium]|nr:DUF4258 domain-containing protein [Planctomycetales bacterium]NIM09994.1 DUF4258 domain-containing protein [Planctomycetales bacterium]NIN09432.1 DUF4258 domain-containing protein [Planctomycetales bacterium]NIN78540.1 DUF4258 domain-containing protein [Planctomycetales bacterium]NIO35733.1 DUF4258 domain-containing protein [Planctomycetales bacterium]